MHRNLFIIMLLGIFSATGIFAQTPEKSNKSDEEIEIARANSALFASQGPLKIEQTQLAALLDHFKEKLGEHLNIVSSEDLSATKYMLPAMELHNVSLYTILQMVQRIMPELEMLVDQGEGFLQLETIPRDHAETTMTLLIKKADRAPAQVETYTYNISDLLDENEPLNIEDLATAIETAWTQQGEAPRADLKFHAETRLLICTAEPALLNIVDQLLSQLEGGEDVVYRSLKVRASKQANPLFQQLTEARKPAEREAALITEIERQKRLLAGQVEERNNAIDRLRVTNERLQERVQELMIELELAQIRMEEQSKRQKVSIKP